MANGKSSRHLICRRRIGFPRIWRYRAVRTPAIAERTKDGIIAARARGKLPGHQPLNADRINAALKLVAAGLSPTNAARQIGLGRSTVYREVKRTGLQRDLETTSS